MHLPHRKRFPTWAKLLISAVVILTPAIFMTLRMMNTQGIACNVCIVFEGKEVCREASGPTKSDCERTGVDNACGSLALGMTNSIRCTGQGSSSIKFH